MTNINSNKPDLSIEFRDVAKPNIVWQEKVKEEGGKKILEGHVTINGIQYKIKIGYNEETLRKKWEMAGSSSELEMTMKKIVEGLNSSDIITLIGKTVTSSVEEGRTSVTDQSGKQLSLDKMKDSRLKTTIAKVAAAFGKSEDRNTVNERIEKFDKPAPVRAEAPSLQEEQPQLENEMEVPLLHEEEGGKPEELLRQESENELKTQLQKRESKLVEFQSALVLGKPNIPLAEKVRLSLARAKRYLGGTRDYIQALENLSELSKHGISSATEKKGTDSPTTYHDYEILASILQKDNGKKALIHDKKGQEYFREFVKNKRDALNTPEDKIGDRFVKQFETNITIEGIESFIRAVTESYERALINDSIPTPNSKNDPKVPESIINPGLSEDEKTKAEGSIGNVINEIKKTEETFLNNIRAFTKETWAPEGKDEKMTFFKRLQFEGIITQNEYLLLQSYWEDMEKTSEETFKGLKDNDASVEEKISSLITQTSPSKMNDQMRNIALTSKNQEEITKILTKVEKNRSNPMAAQLVKEFKSNYESQPPSAISMLPVQRGPRYEILIKEVLKQGKTLMTAETNAALNSNLDYLGKVINTLNELQAAR